MPWYNETDPFAARWLRRLLIRGHLPAGAVDTRKIERVVPGDLDGWRHAHFFAGIGGWPLALEMAGWPGDRPVWTGSCPCQPFSVAGKQKGTDDHRHLWPVWYRLIAEHRPATIFGEQVASPLGRSWLDAVSADLEALGYAVGSADLCAAGVGAPHIRQRLFWVADAGGDQREPRRPGEKNDGQPQKPSGRSENRWLGDAGGERGGRNPRAVSRAEAKGGGEREAARRQPDIAEPSSPDGRGVADAPGQRLDGSQETPGTRGRRQSEDGGRTVRNEGATVAEAGPWRDPDWLQCSDGKLRPTQPGLFPLADGVPGRVGLLRGYGNAIVPQVAAAFVGAFMAA